MHDNRRSRNYSVWLLLGGLLIVAVLSGAYLLGRSGRVPARSTEGAVLVRFPTAVPAPPPTPLPTREPSIAVLQDASAASALDLLRQVAEGKDPYSLSSPLGSFIRQAVCPYGCKRAPRLTRLNPQPVKEWTVTHSIVAAPIPGKEITLRGRLEGSAALLDEQGTTTELVLNGWVYVALSREHGAKWEAEVIKLDPPLVPERGQGASVQPTVPPLPTDTATGLQMPKTPPAPETVAAQQEIANQVLMSVSTLAAGSPLPYRYTPEVEAQLQQIVSRLGIPGQRVTGLSLDPVEWERVEVRDEDTLELAGPDDTAAMVGYLSGTVWLQDAHDNRKPAPLDPTSEHLVVNLHRRAGAWAVINVSDGKVDTHSPEEVKGS